MQADRRALISQSARPGDDTTAPEWRPVVGYEGLYVVSSTGLVRSLTTGRLLTTRPGGAGYPNARLRRDGKCRTFYVHRLAGEAFIGPLPKGMVTRHLDGDPMNNRLENLRYGTYSENSRDQVRHGTHPQASRTHCKHGHGFTSENTYVDAKGSRHCRSCNRERVALADARKRAENPPQPKRAECGTRAGYRQHRAEQTEPCTDCVTAQRAYHAAWREKRRAGREAA